MQLNRINGTHLLSDISLQGSLILASMIIVYHAAFAGVYVFPKDANQYLHFLFEISFLKHATLGVALSILGFNRKQMECNSVYCHFQSPKKFLEAIGYEGSVDIIIRDLLIFFIFFRVVAYIFMRYRIRNK